MAKRCLNCREFSSLSLCLIHRTSTLINVTVSWRGKHINDRAPTSYGKVHLFSTPHGSTTGRPSFCHRSTYLDMARRDFERIFASTIEFFPLPITWRLCRYKNDGNGWPVNRDGRRSRWRIEERRVGFLDQFPSPWETGLHRLIERSRWLM